jgi:hypothetical protein
MNAEHDSVTRRLKRLVRELKRSPEHRLQRALIHARLLLFEAGDTEEEDE